MHFEQLYLGCLAQASYLIADGGDAVIVDPRRDIDDYLERARALGLTIRHVISTHVHADFVAGLTELRAATGATVWLGAAFDGELECERLADGETLRVGAVTIEALATPGHTPESICLLVREPDPNAPLRLLSGDTLFIGDVGRPDLVGSRGFSAEDMARAMFRSLRDKILPLPDDTLVFPGHGAGSACGKNISSETSSTLGLQRLQNWALGVSDEDAFVRELTANLPPPPRYFPHAAALNRSGPALRAELPPLRRLAPGGLGGDAVLLDVRSAARYGQGHVPGSINIWLQGQFASWCGTLLDPNAPIVVLADEPSEADEAVTRLARVGLDHVLGWLQPGEAGVPLGTLAQIPAAELDAALADPELQLLDVRRPGEVAARRIDRAVHLPLDALATAAEVPGLDPGKPTAVICGSGYRSSAACHFLRRLGFADLRNVPGGMSAYGGATVGAGA